MKGWKRCVVLYGGGAEKEGRGGERVRMETAPPGGEENGCCSRKVEGNLSHLVCSYWCAAKITRCVSTFKTQLFALVLSTHALLEYFLGAVLTRRAFSRPSLYSQARQSPPPL